MIHGVPRTNCRLDEVYYIKRLPRNAAAGRKPPDKSQKRDCDGPALLVGRCSIPWRAICPNQHPHGDYEYESAPSCLRVSGRVVHRSPSKMKSSCWNLKDVSICPVDQSWKPWSHIFCMSIQLCRWLMSGGPGWYIASRISLIVPGHAVCCCAFRPGVWRKGMWVPFIGGRTSTAKPI